jgi:hypothetical protein
MSNRSGGSKLSAISGVVIVVAFVMPWVRACGQDLTGYDIATNSPGTIQDAWVYWLVPAVGLLCIALTWLVSTNTTGSRVGVAFARLAAGLIGFLPIVNIWYSVKQNPASLEILYGGWIAVSGFVGIALSFFIDLFAESSSEDM